jgi:phenol 2-monooxygenase
MLGDSTDAVWGVMDIYPRTDFPDIRKKATLHSKSGNLLVGASRNLNRAYLTQYS